MPFDVIRPAIDVALRKESVDRNDTFQVAVHFDTLSLSARRAWIEIELSPWGGWGAWSLSARRAWIEIAPEENPTQKREGRSPQGERG